MDRIYKINLTIKIAKEEAFGKKDASEDKKEENMKRSRVMALIMAAIFTMTGTFAGMPMGAQAADNTAPASPTGLRTEMLEYAYGLNTKNPAFSWMVNDTDQGEVQTAYRILVSSTSALGGDVLDTGWVESSESSFVHADALAEKLADNELYYWQVQTKDAGGAKALCQRRGHS